MMKCIAFVIGIDDYDNFAKLHSAVKDAVDIANALEELKFEVVILTDCAFESAHTKLYEFENKLYNNYDVAVFYYAGHGRMINHSDCLLMKNAPIPGSDEDIRPRAYCLTVDSIMKEFNAIGNQTNIFIIDACRDASDVRGNALYRFGECSCKIPYQTFIAFSTAPGAPAKDGLKGGNSPFAASLLSHIKEENLDIELLFKKVRTDIKQKGYDQYPWEYTCLVDRFCFNYGQLSKYYNQPYCKDAFVRSQYPIPSDDILCKIFQGITSEEDVSGEQNRVFNIICEYKNQLSDSQKFLIGRYVYASAAKGNKSSLDFLSSPNNLLHLQSGFSNHFLKGIYYEIFFDEDDVLRQRPFGSSNLLSTIENLRGQLKDKDSDSFVTAKLPPEYYKNGYALGKTPFWNFRIKLNDANLYDENWDAILLVEDCTLNNMSVLSRIKEKQDNLIIDWKEFRHLIANEFALPYQNIKLLKSGLNNDKLSKVLLTDDVPAIDDFILDECRREIPNEVAILSSLSYIDELESFSLSYVGLNDGEMTISGNISVSVHLEYDGEDIGNMTFPGCFSMHFSKNDNDGKWETLPQRNHIKVDTESFYQ